jgi:hypothetical protein
MSVRPRKSTQTGNISEVFNRCPICIMELREFIQHTNTLHAGQLKNLSSTPGRTKDFSHLNVVQTGAWSYLDSCRRLTGPCSPRGTKQTIHPSVVSRSRIVEL